MLTPKQAAFVREYLKDLNATQAARGCPAFWVTSVEEVCQALLALGFQGLPEPPKAPRGTNPTTRTRKAAPWGSQAAKRGVR